MGINGECVVPGTQPISVCALCSAGRSQRVTTVAEWLVRSGYNSSVEAKLAYLFTASSPQTVLSSEADNIGQRALDLGPCHRGRRGVAAFGAAKWYSGMREAS